MPLRARQHTRIVPFSNLKFNNNSSSSISSKSPRFPLYFSNVKKKKKREQIHEFVLLIINTPRYPRFLQTLLPPISRPFYEKKFNVVRFLKKYPTHSQFLLTIFDPNSSIPPKFLSILLFSRRNFENSRSMDETRAFQDRDPASTIEKLADLDCFDSSASFPRVVGRSFERSKRARDTEGSFGTKGIPYS